ncbi:hypothetical protein ILYODFUR_023880 [Ilyodon furcidens]|uniref:Uncharacterized protein n=1 Tax=Ilyodon furcidens TaxID=33524 RepID=A0ABV0TQA9_9TELE
MFVPNKNIYTINLLVMFSCEEVSSSPSYLKHVDFPSLDFERKTWVSKELLKESPEALHPVSEIRATLPPAGVQMVCPQEKGTVLHKLNSFINLTGSLLKIFP